ncbi:hypothetical protein, partial [Deinococcus pimensis]|uniref:hypothetical protein n=1 Tax=Deinococcus pimensis TaxID=309888 RepID=UPI0005EB4F0A
MTVVVRALLGLLVGLSSLAAPVPTGKSPHASPGKPPAVRMGRVTAVPRVPDRALTVLVAGVTPV